MSTDVFIDNEHLPEMRSGLYVTFESVVVSTPLQQVVWAERDGGGRQRVAISLEMQWRSLDFEKFWAHCDLVTLSRRTLSLAFTITSRQLN